jgi:hypothetical protein
MFFDTTTIKDIVKDTTTVAANSLNIGDLLLALLRAFVSGMLIFIVYQRT